MDSDSILTRLVKSCDRRTFLKACGAAGAAAVAGGVLQGIFKVIPLGGGLHRVSLTRTAMGTFVTVTAVGDSRARAEEAIGRAFDEMDRLVAILSRHDPRSALFVLNDRGSLAGVPAELADVADRSVYFHGLTGGAFDVTVKPLVDLFESGNPSPAEISDRLELVGTGNIERSPGRIAFARSGMGITFDGVAKGYIVDRMSDTLAAHGIEDHLVNAGGDIRARGAAENGKPWTIAIEDPAKKGRYPDVIRLCDGAVATSGSYEAYYDNQRVFHHIVDPHSGTSPRHSVSASVAAGSTVDADILATALIVLGHTGGADLLGRVAGADYLVIGTNGEKYASAGWTALRAERA
jgi:thiamine biosynthesis lipoprotein